MDEEIKDGYLTDDCCSKKTDPIDYSEQNKEIQLPECEMIYQQDFDDINAQFSDNEIKDNDCQIMSQNASFSSDEEFDQFNSNTRANIFQIDHILDKKLKKINYDDGLTK